MRSLLATCILIGAAAVAAPQLFSSYLSESGRTSRSSADLHRIQDVSAGDAERPPSGASRLVEIEAERDGHFYVEAEINFSPVRLMVDTGATVVALRESDAAAAGIRLIESDFTNPVQTANGTTMAAETKLDSVTIDDIEVRNIRALIIRDDQLSLSLLGGSFLNGLQRFEVSDGTLIFEN
jgi:aspartyl protease family protein